MLSRRDALLTTACAALATSVPMQPCNIPTLEDAMGPERMAWLLGLFRIGYAPLVSDVSQEAIFDRPGHFRASPEFRKGMTRYLRTTEPVEILVDFDAPLLTLPSGHTAEQASIDCMIALVLRKAKLLPPLTRCSFAAYAPGSSLAWVRYWQGDDWRKAGWQAPPGKRPRLRPEADWPGLPA